MDLASEDSADCENINEMDENNESALYQKVRDFSYMHDSDSEIPNQGSKSLFRHQSVINL